MNPYEQVMAVLRREEPDRVPFVVYEDKIHRGEFGREMQDRGMGLCYSIGTVFPQMPNVSVETREKDDITTTVYHTPEGDVYTRSQRITERIGTGIEVSHQLDGLIKGPEDYDPVIFMIEDTVYYRDTCRYENLKRDLGTDGVIWENNWGHMFSPPYNNTGGYYGAYTGLEKRIYAQLDYPDHFAALLQALEHRAGRMFPLIAQTPADVIGVGGLSGNYGPHDFGKWVLPFYQKYVPLLQTNGRICKIHAHASNLKGFKETLKATGVRMIDAFTPPPVGDLSIPEARSAWGDDVILWVHIPETIFWYGARETRDYILNLLRTDPNPDRLILSNTEMGMACVSDDEGERVFKDGFRAIADAIDDFQKERH